jgi:hypothetical protein
MLTVQMLWFLRLLVCGLRQLSSLRELLLCLLVSGVGQSLPLCYVLSSGCMVLLANLFSSRVDELTAA